MTKNERIEDALNKIGMLILKNLPKDRGFIFYANEYRKVLQDLVEGEI